MTEPPIDGFAEVVSRTVRRSNEIVSDGVEYVDFPATVIEDS